MSVGLLRLRLACPSHFQLSALPEGRGYEPLAEAALALQAYARTLRSEALEEHCESLCEESYSILCWTLFQSLEGAGSGDAAEAQQAGLHLGRFTSATLSATVRQLKARVEEFAGALTQAVADGMHAAECVRGVSSTLQQLLKLCAERLGRGGRAVAPEDGVGPLAQAASDLGERGEALSDAYATLALSAGRARALSGSGGLDLAIANILETVGALGAGAAAEAKPALQWLRSALDHLQRHLRTCCSFAREIEANAEGLRVVRDSIMSQQATSVRLLELSVSSNPPFLGGDECPVLLARLAALEFVLAEAATDFGLFERQVKASSRVFLSLAQALMAWAEVPFLKASGEGLEGGGGGGRGGGGGGADSEQQRTSIDAGDLPRVLGALKMRAASGKLQDKALKARAAALWEKYRAARNHIAATAGGLGGELGMGGGGSGGAAAAAAAAGVASATSSIHLRFTAAVLGRLFYFPSSLGAYGEGENPNPPTPTQGVGGASRTLSPFALLATLLLLPPGSADAPSGAADTLAAQAAFPSLCSALPPLAVSLVPTHAPLIVESLGIEHWHRWSVPVEQVTTISAVEQQAIALCPASEPEGVPEHLRALYTAVAESLLAVEVCRLGLATLPCLHDLAALGAPGVAFSECTMGEPLMRAVLASILLLVSPDSEDGADAASTVAKASPWCATEADMAAAESAAAAAAATHTPRICLSRAVRPHPSAQGPSEIAGAAVAQAEGFSPALVRAVLGGAFLPRLARAEATLEVPLAEALEMLETTQATNGAIQAIEARQLALRRGKMALFVGQSLTAEQDEQVLQQGLAFAKARHSALGTSVVLLLEVCDQHAAYRLPVLNRVQALLAGAYVPSLTFLSPAGASLHSFCSALLKAELLAVELAQQVLRHAASALHVETEAARTPAPRTAPHLQRQPQQQQAAAPPPPPQPPAVEAAPSPQAAEPPASASPPTLTLQDVLHLYQDMGVARTEEQVKNSFPLFAEDFHTTCIRLAEKYSDKESIVVAFHQKFTTPAPAPPPTAPEVNAALPSERNKAPPQTLQKKASVDAILDVPLPKHFLASVSRLLRSGVPGARFSASDIRRLPGL